MYLTELLNPRGSKVTLECQKIQEYVAECLQCAAVVPEAAAAAEVKGIIYLWVTLLCAAMYGGMGPSGWDIDNELAVSEHCKTVIPQKD